MRRQAFGPADSRLADEATTPSPEATGADEATAPSPRASGADESTETRPRAEAPASARPSVLTVMAADRLVARVSSQPPFGIFRAGRARVPLAPLDYAAIELFEPRRAIEIEAAARRAHGLEELRVAVGIAGFRVIEGEPPIGPALRRF